MTETPLELKMRQVIQVKALSAAIQQLALASKALLIAFEHVVPAEELARLREVQALLNQVDPNKPQ